MVLLETDLTEEEVSDNYDGLAVVQEEGKWGVDATEFVAWIKDAADIDLFTLPSLHPDALDRLSLCLSLSLIAEAPQTLASYGQVGRLTQFTHLVRRLSARKNTVLIRQQG